METLPLILLPAPIACIYFPKPALAFIIGAWVGNLMYMAGYTAPAGSSGFKGMRPLGAFLRFLCIMGNLICAIWSSIEVIKYGAATMAVEAGKIACAKDRSSDDCKNAVKKIELS